MIPHRFYIHCIIGFRPTSSGFDLHHRVSTCIIGFRPTSSGFDLHHWVSTLHLDSFDIYHQQTSWLSSQILPSRAKGLRSLRSLPKLRSLAGAPRKKFWIELSRPRLQNYQNQPSLTSSHGKRALPTPLISKHRGSRHTMH